MRTLSMLKVSAGLVAAVLTVASLAPAAQAQRSELAVKVDVPFAFESASGQHFAPGVYTISQTDEAVVIEGKSATGLVLTQLAFDHVAATQGKAVFTHYGDKYFLRAVWSAGSSAHLLFKQSKAERQSQIAGNRTTTNRRTCAVADRTLTHWHPSSPSPLIQYEQERWMIERQLACQLPDMFPVLKGVLANAFIGYKLHAYSAQTIGLLGRARWALDTQEGSAA